MTRERILESYFNGQKRQFAEQATEYGLANFVNGLMADVDAELITAPKALEIIQTLVTLTEEL